MSARAPLGNSRSAIATALISSAARVFGAHAAVVAVVVIGGSPRVQRRRVIAGPRGGAQLVEAARPLAPPSPLNGPLSLGRYVACAVRPLEHLSSIRHRFAATGDDVLLAASAGALRELLLAHGRPREP